MIEFTDQNIGDRYVYPVQSRSPVIDAFQEIEEKLRQLKNCLVFNGSNIIKLEWINFESLIKKEMVEEFWKRRAVVVIDSCGYQLRLSNDCKRPSHLSHSKLRPYCYFSENAKGNIILGGTKNYISPLNHRRALLHSRGPFSADSGLMSLCCYCSFGDFYIIGLMNCYLLDH